MESETCRLFWFDQIEEHYSAQGLFIVGYFHANERYDDAELNGVAKNIGDHICRYFPQAAVLLVSIVHFDVIWLAFIAQHSCWF